MKANIKNILFVLFLSYSFLNANSNKEWEGQYLGFALGQGKAKANLNTILRENSYFNAQDLAQLNPLTSKNLTDSNVVGSIIWGYNKQNKSFVYGIETDFSFSNFKDTNNTGNRLYNSNGDIFKIQSEIKSNYVLSIRPKVGYATKKSLFTISAGPALTQIDYNFKFNDSTGPNTDSLNEKKWALGLSGSIGYEYLLNNNWRLKLDYLYYKFNDVINKKSQLSNNPTDGFNHNIDFEVNTFRIGFVKKF